MARPKGSKNKAALARKKPGRKPAAPTLNSLLKQPYDEFDARAEMIALYKSIRTTPKTIDKKLQILRELNALNKF